MGDRPFLAFFMGAMLASVAWIFVMVAAYKGGACSTATDPMTRYEIGCPQAKPESAPVQPDSASADAEGHILSAKAANK